MLTLIQDRVRNIGVSCNIELETDSSAAKGVAGRLGAGKRLRHLEVQQFFLQGLVKQGEANARHFYIVYSGGMDVSVQKEGEPRRRLEQREPCPVSRSLARLLTARSSLSTLVLGR